MNTINKDKEFEDAINRFGGVITRICYYFSTDSEEFKDLRQEVFYNIWRGLDKFNNDSKLSTWIYRVSFNTCISFRRKNKKINKVSVQTLIDMPEGEAHYSTKEEYKMLHELILQLRFEERAIILMWLDEMSYDEISQLTGLNRNTVAVKIKRIKEKLIKMGR
ncbi:MAG: sigma-70 family RNA polymerase sigma factor [Muribaculaceae bacterium]|nr:sigma-70 family RNA polymerase sigma factor [Muribaculaceae bacterium]